MAEYENHGVTRVDVVAAVDVISVDAEAEPCLKKKFQMLIQRNASVTHHQVVRTLHD